MWGGGGAGAKTEFQMRKHQAPGKDFLTGGADKPEKAEEEKKFLASEQDDVRVLLIS